MIFNPLPATTYVEHRQKLAAELPPGSMAILHANDKMPKSGDQFFPFVQNKDLLRLTGIWQEETALILFPDHAASSHREILFIKKINDHHKTWDGDLLDKEKAQTISGVQSIFWFDEFDVVLHPLMGKAKEVFLNSNEKNSPYPIENRNERLGKVLMAKYPFHTYKRLQPILLQHTILKSPHELSEIKKAIRLTGNTWNHLQTIIKPGMYEYEIAAEITYQFELNGATHAFEPIVASGANACVLHYKSNNHKIQPNDCVLVDFGAEKNGYAADMTRCKAADGVMNQRQFMIYDAVLQLFSHAKSMLKPGNTIHEANESLLPLVLETLFQLGVITSDQSKDKTIAKKYLPHGVSHFLGMDVHDYGDKHMVLQPGMVLTCEPGLYVREEGIGIRLENDLLITENGNEDLMSDYEL